MTFYIITMALSAMMIIYLSNELADQTAPFPRCLAVSVAAVRNRIQFVAEVEEGGERAQQVGNVTDVASPGDDVIR